MYNRILNEQDRKDLQPIIEDMFKLCPLEMAKKIPEANINQAFIVDMVMKNYKDGNKLLCVGMFEDTAYDYLIKKGYSITGIDPAVNYDLHTFINNTQERFDIIFSTSVIEHVRDDEQFMSEVCKLLNVNGYAFLTTDFREDYNKKTPKPSVDFRLYTSTDYLRLNTICSKHGCFFLDSLVPDVAPYFSCGGGVYSFSTMVIKKIR